MDPLGFQDQRMLFMIYKWKKILKYNFFFFLSTGPKVRYDENGNVISHMKGAEMTYDTRGHLSKVTLGTRTSVSYYYDHHGRIIARFGPEDMDITQFFYAHEGKPHLISHVYKPHQGKN